jgi:ATP-dependent RNA helicase DeaD
MLDMGFSESIDTILAGVPKDRNTLFFSATMSKEIEAISKKYLNNAKEIVVGSRNEGAEKVNHIYYLVSARDKYRALKRVADYYPDIYAIIFCRTRMECQDIADKLIQDGYNAEALHGELSQAQRDLTMQKFRQKRVQFLVATDVAARGLDVDNLTHVINYGLPDDIESYTHRSGRTGRAGKKGTSISIIHVKEKPKVRAIEKQINKDFVAGKLPSGEEICEKQLYKVIDDIQKVEVDEEEIAPYLPAIYRKFELMEKEDIIKKVVSNEFNMFLDYYKNEDEIEVPSERGERGKDRKERGDKPSRHDRKGGGSRTAEVGYTRLFINLGKKDNLGPRQLMGLVNRCAKGKRIDMGRIDLMKTFSFFEVPVEQAGIVLSALRNAEYDGRKVNVEVSQPEAGAQGGGNSPAQHFSEQGRKPNRAERRKAARNSDAKARRSEEFVKANRKRGGRPEWAVFFDNIDDRPLKGDDPDFSEEGWARRKRKKRK